MAQTPEQRRAAHAEAQRRWRLRNPDYKEKYDFAKYTRDRRAADPLADITARAKWKASKPENYLLRKSKDRARLKGLEHDLTAEWLKTQLAKGVCQVTGLPFDYTIGTAKVPNPWSPSVDRIDSSRGYLQDNCRVVVWIYNVSKGAWGDEDVLRMAQALMENT